MAETAVAFLLQRLNGILVDEARLSIDVRREVNAIKLDLENMQSILRDADSRTTGDSNSQAVETWVEQVRRATYDSEDIIDKFILLFGRPPGAGIRGSVRTLYRSITHLRERHNLARRIGDMKQRIRAISERKNWHELNRFGKASSSTGGDETKSLNRLAEIAEDTAAVGMEHEMETLKASLVGGGEELTTILLHGGAGMGKTTLAEKVYNDHDVMSHFDCHAWVTISISFRPRIAFYSMLKRFYRSSNEMFPYKLKEKDMQELAVELNIYLKKRRYLLVLDDVWGAHVLESLGRAFPSDDCGSRVLVTSRDPHVVSSIGRAIERPFISFKLDPLPPEASIELFCRKAFQGGICPTDLVDCCHDLVHRCGGWPIAIVTLGAAMSKKEQSPRERKRVYDHLGTELGVNQDLDDLRKVISQLP